MKNLSQIKDFIFSDAIMGRIQDTDIAIEWYDPDTSYAEDVLAYVKALLDKAERP